MPLSGRPVATEQLFCPRGFDTAQRRLMQCTPDAMYRYRGKRNGDVWRSRDEEPCKSAEPLSDPQTVRAVLAWKSGWSLLHGKTLNAQTITLTGAKWPSNGECLDFLSRDGERRGACHACARGTTADTTNRFVGHHPAQRVQTMGSEEGMEIEGLRAASSTRQRKAKPMSYHSGGARACGRQRYPHRTFGFTKANWQCQYRELSYAC